MPKRTDISKILILGSGPIVIGQSAEFDYSGTQACKALKSEGYEVVLVNSNPATIMTDPEIADRTYIEPMTLEYLEEIIHIERERSPGTGFAVLPTVGGQTALNLAIELSDGGVLEKYDVSLIGANVAAIKKAEDRLFFKDAMQKIGLDVPKSALVNSTKDGLEFAGKIGFPVIVRPSFTLGGSGGGIAYNREELLEVLTRGLDMSPVHEALIEESVLGWKEFELEVMRDTKDNVIIICSIENFDPMGVHTGDSITVAPAQTLTDKEYQIMRDAALRIIREIGVDTGGSNIQFAIDPASGRMVIIEMNPRVSRSSALASKATGFPIAKIAAKLAVGYRLDEIPNDITRMTPSCFEPTIDYVVTKIPRFAFEKFRGAADELGPQMKSVGEAMAIGRTFKESLQKALRSLEIGSHGLESGGLPETPSAEALAQIRAQTAMASSHRLYHLADALRLGITRAEVYQLSKIDPWFIDAVAELVAEEKRIAREPLGQAYFREFKPMGFSDRRIAELRGIDEAAVASARRDAGVTPGFKSVDTCGAEFEAFTPYLYSTYEGEDEAPPTARKKVIILGGGPNRIGQGIEFDYCCVHAAYSLREAGIETIMINCNPETVSTDYDTSDRLYFEPLTVEDVVEIVRVEERRGTLLGVIVQFGGQTPLKLAAALERVEIPILGTSPDAIDLAEDRRRFQQLLKQLGLRQPDNGTAHSASEAEAIALDIGYPVVIRPSYVLGGRAMEIVHDAAGLQRYITHAVSVSGTSPVLIDRYLRNAIEVDVDAVADGRQVEIAGIMEHIEEAGIHSGNSACALPPHSLSPATIAEIEGQTVALARALGVVGLMNVQFAVQDGLIFVLEVNPRASRTVPFVAKATGVPIAKIAARIMAGEPYDNWRQYISGKRLRAGGHAAVKEAVLPFARFPGVDPILSPEMKSTREAMGLDSDFGRGFAKSQLGSGTNLPLEGCVFVSVRDQDKGALVEPCQRLIEMGFSLVATNGTAETLSAAGLPVMPVNKVREGRPHIVDHMLSGAVQLVFNTTEGAQAIADSFSLRRTALTNGIPYYTTVAGARAAVQAIAALRAGNLEVAPLQSYL